MEPLSEKGGSKQKHFAPIFIQFSLFLAQTTEGPNGCLITKYVIFIAGGSGEHCEPPAGGPQ